MFSIKFIEHRISGSNARKSFAKNLYLLTYSKSVILGG